jgi:hypothetical protein
MQDWIRSAEIPAESGGEWARAKYVQEQLPSLGFTRLRTSDIGNVIGEWPGTDPRGQ